MCTWSFLGRLAPSGPPSLPCFVLSISPPFRESTQSRNIGTVYLQAIKCELAPKEDIHQPHLSKNVHQVEQLAEDELVDVYVVTENKNNVVTENKTDVKLSGKTFNFHLRRLLIT